MVDNARDLVKIDLKDIEDRISELKKIRSNKPYEKQKSSIHRELVRFLASLPTPKSLSSASPGDIQKFLVWKDKSGRTKVHQMSCPQVGQSRSSSCSCPSRLASGTVDSLLESSEPSSLKLDSEENGMTGWELETPFPILP